MDEQKPPQGPREEGITAADVRWIIGGILAILFGIFIAQNADPVRVQVVFFTAEVRLIWVFLICAALGAVIDRLLQRRGVLPSTRRRQRKEARQRDQKAQ